jgi:hypothetical protein
MSQNRSEKIASMVTSSVLGEGAIEEENSTSIRVSDGCRMTNGC